MVIKEVAQQWAAGFQEHEAKALVDVVNFALKCAGCNSKIDEDDVADPDNCANRLAELQDEYQAVRDTRSNCC
jgi:cohesin complex subunit SA-1/2